MITDTEARDGLFDYIYIPYMEDETHLRGEIPIGGKMIVTLSTEQLINDDQE